MIAPLRDKSSKRKMHGLPTSTPALMPAPTKGWYVGANIADAPAGTAYILDNAFPQLDYIRMRRGSASWATGMTNATVSTIMTYNGPTSSKMFAVVSGSIYDVSSSGIVGAAAVTGLNSAANLEYVQFQGLSGSYLIAMNGQDGAQVFDGTAWNLTYSPTANTSNVTATPTGNTTSTSTTISSLSSATGLVAGMLVSGTGIQAGTTIVSVNAGALTMVISLAATATNTATPLTCSNATIVTNISSMTGIYAGQSFTGPGIPSGTTVISVNALASSIIISQAATATASGVTLMFYKTPPISGLTGNPLVYPWIFKSRLYAVERDSLNVWYLGVSSIGGAATQFSLSSIFKYGGYIVAGASWAISSNSGLYEVFVAITSEGEVAIYDGGYPGDPAWTIKGLYKISKPLGRRCILKAGGDLAIMTEDGIVPMSSVMTLDQIALQNKAVTAPIAPAWRTAVLARQGISGWQIITWPLESMAIVCLPKAAAGDNTQFIANARTGAWARYLGWDANCFGVYNNQLFYGTSDGRVMQAETGGQDDGANYTWTVFPSYSHLGSKAARKLVKMVRPRIQSSFPITPQVTIKTDYDTTAPANPGANPITATGAVWDTARWNVDVWPADLSDQSAWRASEGLGMVIAPVVQLTLSTTQTPDIRLTATEILYEGANSLG